MNQKTITGSTDSNGLFTAKNPYEIFNCKLTKDSNQWLEFANAHPPLFCYNENNQLVISRDNVEVIETWQWNYKPFAMPNGWRNVGLYAYEKYTFEQFAKANWGLQTRRVYLTVSPTETNMSDVPLSPMKPYYEELGKRMMEDEGGAKEVGRINNYIMGLDMPASKELKSAEEIKAGGDFKIVWPEIADGHLKGYDGELHPVYTRETIQEMLNAQFATEAGGEADNDLLICLRQMLYFSDKWGKEWFTKDQWNMIENCKKVASKNDIVTDGAGFHIPSTAPSNNSSSEMVDLISEPLLFEKIYGFNINDFDFTSPVGFSKSLAKKTGMSEDEVSALSETISMFLSGRSEIKTKHEK